MHPLRKRRLIYLIGILIGVSIATTLTLFALRQNINLYFTPTQVAAGMAPDNHAFRVGGIVKTGSIQREPNSLLVRFIIHDDKHELNMSYTGVLPDLFREKQNIIAEGSLDSQGSFMATQVLAKHGEYYKPMIPRKERTRDDIWKRLLHDS